ncbi:hypothetical protein AB4205_07150 [Vibrio sp. 10N.286.49.F3]|uniref:hypothetical protein n=1 Tax=Vibrio sp. 10N.286.49.F3 TaxID=3229704 RepID=UPI00354EB4F2
MLERFCFGIALGVVLWCFLREEKIEFNQANHPILVGTLAISAIAFIISSAAFGLIFAGAAVIEMTIGFALANKLFGRPSDMSLEQYKEVLEQQRLEKQRKAELKAIRKAKRIEASKRRVKWYFIILCAVIVGYQATLISDYYAKQPQTQTTTKSKVETTKTTSITPNRTTTYKTSSTSENRGKLVVSAWEHKAWRVASVNDYVMMNATNSVNGSFLGVLRRLNNCDSRTLSLTLKANLADHVDIYGKNFPLRFSTDKGLIAVVSAKVVLIKTTFQGRYNQEIEYSISPIPSNLITAFKRRDNVRVDVDGNANYTDGISLYGATFDLAGFTATYLKADEACLVQI